MLKKIFTQIAQFIEKFSLITIFFIVIFTALSVWGISKIQMVTDYSTFINTESKPFQDNEKFEKNFGSDPIIILFSGDIESVLESKNLIQLQKIEEKITKNKKSFITVGPASMIDLALKQQLAEFQKNNSAIPQDKISTLQDFSLANKKLVKKIVFNQNGQVRPNFKSVFPDNNHAIIAIRMAGGLTFEEKEDLFNEIKKITGNTRIEDVQSSVTGTISMLLSMKEEISKSMLVLLLISVALMILILGVIFKVRWRLLSLPVILIAVIWTFGIMGWISIPLTIVTMALLPILIGLGIDYAIQFHNRYEEEMHQCETSKQAIIDAIKHISPPILIALIASVFGFASLFISKVPMIQDFGLMLIIGVICSFVVGLFIINSVLYQRDKKLSKEVVKIEAKKSYSGFLEKIIKKITRFSFKFSVIVFIIAAGASILGFLAIPKIPLQTDIEKFVPQNAPSVKDLHVLREIMETTSQINIMVENHDITNPEVIQWIDDFSNQEAAKYSKIKSVNSVATLIKSSNREKIPSDSQQIKMILEKTPENLQKTIINPEHTLTIVSFGVEHMEINKMKDLVESIEDDIKQSVLSEIYATPTGLEVLSAKTLDSLVANRHQMTFLGIALIFLVLLIVHRSLMKAILPIIPIGLVIGWSNGVMYFLGIEYNPLSITLGVLILGVGSEYTILLMERYFEERKKNKEPKQAMIATTTKIGKAIITSAFTTIGGFIALVASSFVILSNFGLVIVIDIFLILISALFVLPPLIILIDKWWSKVKSKQVQSTCYDKKSSKNNFY